MKNKLLEIIKNNLNYEYIIFLIYNSDKTRLNNVLKVYKNEDFKTLISVIGEEFDDNLYNQSTNEIILNYVLCNNENSVESIMYIMGDYYIKGDDKYVN